MPNTTYAALYHVHIPLYIPYLACNGLNTIHVHALCTKGVKCTKLFLQNAQNVQICQMMVCVARALCT